MRCMTGPQPSPGQPSLYPPQQGVSKRKVRVFSWVIVAINVLCLLFVIVAINGAAQRYGTDCQSLDQRTCEAAQGIGSTIGVGLLVFAWMAIDVILGVIWLVTRKR